METFRVISGIACFIGIVIAIMDSLYPNEKYEKQMKMIFSLVFLLCVSGPIVSGEVTISDDFISAGASSDELSGAYNNTYDYFVKSIENNISTSLKAKLSEHEINAEEILTSINISDDSSISISEVEIVLSDPAENQDAIVIIQSEVGEDVPVKAKESAYAGTD